MPWLSQYFLILLPSMYSHEVIESFVWSCLVLPLLSSISVFDCSFDVSDVGAFFCHHLQTFSQLGLCFPCGFLFNSDTCLWLLWQVNHNYDFHSLHWTTKSTVCCLSHIPSHYVFHHQPMMARPKDHTSDEMVCLRMQAAWLEILIRPGEIGVQAGESKVWVCMTYILTGSKKNCVYIRTSGLSCALMGKTSGSVREKAAHLEGRHLQQLWIQT